MSLLELCSHGLAEIDFLHVEASVCGARNGAAAEPGLKGPRSGFCCSKNERDFMAFAENDAALRCHLFASTVLASDSSHHKRDLSSS